MGSTNVLIIKAKPPGFGKTIAQYAHSKLSKIFENLAMLSSCLSDNFGKAFLKISCATTELPIFNHESIVDIARASIPTTKIPFDPGKYNKYCVARS